MRRKDGAHSEISRARYAREKGSLAKKRRNFRVRRAHTHTAIPTPTANQGINPSSSLAAKKGHVVRPASAASFSFCCLPCLFVFFFHTLSLSLSHSLSLFFILFLFRVFLLAGCLALPFFHSLRENVAQVGFIPKGKSLLSGV